MSIRRKETASAVRIDPRLLFLTAVCVVLLMLAVPVSGQDTAGQAGETTDAEDMFGEAADSPAEVPADGSASSDDEDIFGTGEEIAETTGDDTSVRDAFLQTEGVTLTGSFSGALGTTFTWNDPWSGSFNLFDPAGRVMNPEASAVLGFSAKPSTDLGFYGEVRTAYPFVTDQALAMNEVTVIDRGDPLDPTDDKVLTGTVGGTATVPDFRIFKLYSRFNWNNTVFLSFGKQSLKWGQGLFFAPANDLFSLSAIDLDDPEAEREGPLSLRINTPVPGTLANFYLFTVFKGASMDPLSVAVAPKFEIGFPGLEFSVSGYYQKDEKPKLISSASFARDEWTLFGEGLVSFGSRKLFLVSESGSWGLEERSDDLFFTGTLGGVYRRSWEKKLDLSVMGQYLYDGEGQDNLSVLDLSEALADNPMLIASLGRFGTRLGRHYGALSVSAGNILESDISVSVFALANFGDLSGWVKPQVTWQIFDRMSVAFWASAGFGEKGDEYASITGLSRVFSGFARGNTTINEDDFLPTLQAGITFTLGSGSF